MGATFGVVRFPGTNCDRDVVHWLRDVLGCTVRSIWHEEEDLRGVQCVVLPGGFAYGDYLRVGAIARFSPVMREVARFAGAAGAVLGICNGFQILLEAGLLPGAMVANRSLRFVCRHVTVRVESDRSVFTQGMQSGSLLRLPVAHHDGCYVCEPAVLAELEARGQVVFRYTDGAGRVSEAANPNGSVASIAGVANSAGNVVGLMPHPERAAEAILGESAGRQLIEAFLATVR